MGSSCWTSVHNKRVSIGNTFFYQPDENYLTCKHPCSCHYHLLDYAITWKSYLPDVLCTKAIRGPKSSSEFCLVRCQLRMKITLPRRKTPASLKLKKLDISKLTDPEHCRELTKAVEAALECVQLAGEEVQQRSKALKEAVYSASGETLGHSHRKTPGWFWQHCKGIERFLEEKKSKHLRHLQENSKRSKSALAEVKAKVQKEVRTLKNNWWQRRAEKLQSMADDHDYRGLFTGQKAIYGPKSNAVAPVKSADGNKLITDLQDTWKEHFNNLPNQEGPAHPDACQQLKRKLIQGMNCAEKSLWRNLKLWSQQHLAKHLV